MERITKIILGILIVGLALIILATPAKAPAAKAIEEIYTPETETTPERQAASLAAHTRVAAAGGTTDPEEWLLALEWCESNCDNARINEIDRDGTPSYHLYQFKPDTLRGYGEAYGIIPQGLTDTEILKALKDIKITRAIVRAMMKDPSVDWYQQFPDCVRRLGLPPR